MVENIFEELDAPGEWFYQAESSTLYYYPMPDGAVASAEVPLKRTAVESKLG